MMSRNVWESMLGRVTSLARDEVMNIIDKAAETFLGRPFIVKIPRPTSRLTVCGDVHGQYMDMMRIFQNNGVPTVTNPYLFNGDVVDRGPNSKACILTLLLYRLMDPASLLINRGNHELMEMNAYYGFRKELKDDELFRRFNELFDLLPIAHVIGEKFFVVHGGLPRRICKLDDIQDNEYQELLWNDPCEKLGITENPRGPGTYRFGPDVTERFLNLNKMDILIRSHEMVREGFEYSQNGKCVTVFSAPNYAGYYKNKGGYMIISNDLTVTGHKFDSHSSSKL